MVGPLVGETCFSVSQLSCVRQEPFLSHTVPLQPSTGALCMGCVGVVVSLEWREEGIKKVHNIMHVANMLELPL